MMLRRSALIACLCLLGVAPAQAETFDVKMLTRGVHGAMVFEPEDITLAPGDTLRFLPSDRSHNAASIPSMLPAGAVAFKGKIDQETSVTFDVPGVYGIKCSPHFAMGMVMLVRVGAGSPAEITLPADLPERARTRFEEIIERSGAAGSKG